MSHLHSHIISAFWQNHLEIPMWGIIFVMVVAIAFFAVQIWQSRR